MKIAQLQARLDAEGVNPNAYSLPSGNKPEDEFRIEKRGIRWHVYYTERGIRIIGAKFLREEKACDYFLELVLKDQTTRER